MKCPNCSIEMYLTRVGKSIIVKGKQITAGFYSYKCPKCLLELGDKEIMLKNQRIMIEKLIFDGIII